MARSGPGNNQQPQPVLQARRGVLWWRRFWQAMAFNKSLFARVMVGYVGVTLGGIALVALVSSIGASRFILADQREDLLRKAHNVNAIVTQFAASPEDLAAVAGDIGTLLRFLGPSLGAETVIFDQQGTPLLTSDQDRLGQGGQIQIPEAVITTVQGGKTYAKERTPEGYGGEVLLVAVPLGEDDAPWGGVLLYKPTTEMRKAIGGLRETILWVTLTALLVSLAIGSYIASTIARPIRTLGTIVADLGTGQPVDDETWRRLRAEDEVGDLSAAIRRLSTRLNEAETERARLEDSRRQFLIDVAHELRTPMTGIRGFLEALIDDIADDPQVRRRYLQLILDQTIHVTRLVEDLLDLSRMDIGHVRILKEPVDLVPLAMRVLERLRPRAEEAGNTMEFFSDGGEATILGDPDRLEQIVTNLIQNAIANTRAGEIKVSVAVAGDRVRLDVADTGIGIPPEDLPHIWERFQRGDRARRGGGVGLGLAIVRRLTELHGGRIAVESRPQHGTRFSLTFPLYTVYRRPLLPAGG